MVIKINSNSILYSDHLIPLKGDGYWQQILSSRNNIEMLKDFLLEDQLIVVGHIKITYFLKNCFGCPYIHYIYYEAKSRLELNALESVILLSAWRSVFVGHGQNRNVP